MKKKHIYEQLDDMTAKYYALHVIHSDLKVTNEGLKRIHETTKRELQKRPAISFDANNELLRLQKHIEKQRETIARLKGENDKISTVCILPIAEFIQQAGRANRSYNTGTNAKLREEIAELKRQISALTADIDTYKYNNSVLAERHDDAMKQIIKHKADCEKERKHGVYMQRLNEAGQARFNEVQEELQLVKRRNNEQANRIASLLEENARLSAPPTLERNINTSGEYEYVLKNSANNKTIPSRLTKDDYEKLTDSAKDFYSVFSLPF